MKYVVDGNEFDNYEEARAYEHELAQKKRFEENSVTVRKYLHTKKVVFSNGNPYSIIAILTDKPNIDEIFEAYAEKKFGKKYRITGYYGEDVHKNYDLIDCSDVDIDLVENVFASHPTWLYRTSFQYNNVFGYNLVSDLHEQTQDTEKIALDMEIDNPIEDFIKMMLS